MRHLLIIGILAIAFSVSMMIRSQGAEFGFELNEFDPYYNYRATEFLVENGYDAYYEWHDDMAWYPMGRDISATSQSMLHLTAAATYSVFGGDTDLYSFTIIFPAVIGALTAIVMFALVRTIAGTTAGLIASLLFAVSPSIIVRGTIGWFKSEPMGLFYGILASYFLLSGIRTEDKRIAAAKVIAGGVFLAFGLGSWGGIQYFVIPIAIFIMALPFFRNDYKFLLWVIPLFGIVFLGITATIERPGIDFVLGVGGVAVMASIALMGVTIFIKSKSSSHGVRNGLVFLFGGFAAAMSFLYANSIVNILPSVAFRYANALNPFLTTVNPLTDSVAEHATATTAQSFWFLSILMLFAGIGAWFILSGKLNRTLKTRPEMAAFALIMGMTGLYVSSAFIRLELFASIAVIILSSIAISTLAQTFFNPERPDKKYKRKQRSIMHVAFIGAIVVLLIIPTLVPASNWVSGVKAPPTILNGGASFGMITNDWLHALEWMRENTPPDSVVAAWWDYGYWITTVGERTSLADNGTINSTRIAELGRMMMSHPDEAWLTLQKLEADYVLLFIAAQYIESQPPVYLLNGGGDEQKNYWFIRIAEEPLDRYLEADASTETEFFWQNTIMGQMTPFTPLTYINLATNEQTSVWRPGSIALMQKDLKITEDSDGPLRFAYASPSFYTEGQNIIGVFIYEVNKDYVPSAAPGTANIPQRFVQLTAIETNKGNILVQMDESQSGIASGFVEQANAGAFDGIIFHRIVPGVLLQAGDPASAGPLVLSGAGVPGLPGDSFENIGAKYLLAVQRGETINDADSQFFIINTETPWLAGDYVPFGAVISGDDVIDAISELETDDNNVPLDQDGAQILQITTNSIGVP